MRRWHRSHCAAAWARPRKNSKNSSLRAWRLRGTRRRRDRAFRRAMDFPESSRTFRRTRAQAPEREHLAGKGTQGKLQLGGFGDRRPREEHVVIAALDGAQNLEAAAAEEIEIQGQVALDPPDQGQAVLEHLTG